MRTPLPWIKNGYNIISEDNLTICVCEIEADTQFIVYSVNNIERVEKHRDELLEAAKHAKFLFERMKKTNLFPEDLAIYSKLEKAISEASEK